MKKLLASFILGLSLLTAGSMSLAQAPAPADTTIAAPVADAAYGFFDDEPAPMQAAPIRVRAILLRAALIRLSFFVFFCIQPSTTLGDAAMMKFFITGSAGRAGATYSTTAPTDIGAHLYPGLTSLRNLRQPDADRRAYFCGCFD